MQLRSYKKTVQDPPTVLSKFANLTYQVLFILACGKESPVCKHVERTQRRAMNRMKVLVSKTLGVIVKLRTWFIAFVFKYQKLIRPTKLLNIIILS